MKTKTKKQTKKKSAAAPVVSAAPETVLVLRTCAKDMKAHGGFEWPKSGPVETPAKWWGEGRKPDGLKLGWDPSATCGGGLHGLLWGEGNGEHLDWTPDANWLVVRVLKADIVDLSGKVKFPRGEVVFCGSPKGATEYLSSAPEGRGRAIAGLIVSAGRSEAATAGYKGTATAGYKGTATAGESGTATAGESGTATAGESGTATAGESGTATAGNYGTATAGYKGTATAGYKGTATAGYKGTATAGNYGTATAGYKGTATAGESGTATAGYKGTATAGETGILVLRWWDGKRYRFVVGYVGEEGIVAGKYYRLDSANKIVSAPDVDAAMAAKAEEAKK